MKLTQSVSSTRDTTGVFALGASVLLIIDRCCVLCREAQGSGCLAMCSFKTCFLVPAVLGDRAP